MMTALIVSNILQWALILLLALAVVLLLRQVGLLHERIRPVGALVLPGGPEAGTNAPAFTLPSIDGRQVSIGGVAERERATLLFFLSPTCPICKTLLPVVKSIAAREGDRLAVVLASDGDEPAQQRMVRESKLEQFPLVLSTPLGLAYQVSKLPYAVLIGPDGMIAAKGLVNTREHLESLFEARDRGVASLQDYMRSRQEDRAVG